MEKEKANKYDVLTEITRRIRACFGDADNDFAMHPADEKTAKELRKLAAENGISLKEMQNIFCGHIYRLRLIPEYEKEQRNKANKFFSKKLS